MTNTIRLVALVVLVALTGCESFDEAMTAHTDVVARAEGHELTIDETATLLAQNPRIPAQPNVIEAFANLWVDYTLLAEAASRDSTLAVVDLEPRIRPIIEQRLIVKLRDEVIQVDTALTDEELRALFEEEQPGLEVRARHILLRLPEDATAAERDSIMALAEELRTRAASGEDFAALAREYSEDPGSAAEGGDLGFFGEGEMVAPFEEAAFALEVGGVSQVVETPFGFHIIKVAERRLPEFEQYKEGYRERIIATRRQESTREFVEQLTESRDIEVREDAYDVVRELAEEPNTELSDRAAERALVVYEGGAFTAGEFLRLIHRSPAGARSRLAAASDDQLAALLRGITRNEILLQAARERGIQLTPAERDSLMARARQQLTAATQSAGFAEIEPRQGETTAEAISRSVKSLLEGVVTQQRRVVPLGPIAYSLREQYEAEVFERAFPAVIARVEERRSAPAMPSAGQSRQPAQQPDTAAATRR